MTSTDRERGAARSREDGEQLARELGLLAARPLEERVSVEIRRLLVTVTSPALRAAVRRAASLCPSPAPLASPVAQASDASPVPSPRRSVGALLSAAGGPR